jgi:hypothetical protein
VDYGLLVHKEMILIPFIFLFWWMWRGISYLDGNTCTEVVRHSYEERVSQERERRKKEEGKKCVYN